MTSLLQAFALAALAGLLLPSASYHAVRLRAFRDLIAAHALVPRPAVTWVALLVTAFEAAAGSAALVSLVGGLPTAWPLFAVCAGVGGAFVAYLARLLARGQRAPCGCTPLAAELTPFALAPAVLLSVASSLGLVAALAPAAPAPPGATLLGAAWGTVAAVLAVLAPAAAPPMTRRTA